MNLNGAEYFYIRNAQGDITGLLDKNGAEVVTYTYDSWGKMVSITGSKASDVGEKNPYRYRGYRYDSETGLYYLQSRYYNPEWGRFINADGLIGTPGQILSTNMFSYCKNNPVNMIDKDGRFAFLLVPLANVFVTAAQVVTLYVAYEATKYLVNQAVDWIYSESSSSDSESPSKPNEDIFGIPSAETPTASKVREDAQSKGWTKTKEPNKPEKWVDENGIPRVTLKQGSPRTPGSENPHLELRDFTGQRIDRFGNPVSKRSPENHTPLKWDVTD